MMSNYIFLLLFKETILPCPCAILVHKMAERLNTLKNAVLHNYDSSLSTKIKKQPILKHRYFQYW